MTIDQHTSPSTEEPGIYDYDTPPKPKRGLRKDKSARPSWFDDRRAMGGLVLIGLGIVFFLQGIGLLGNFNWWAFFLLVPGITMLCQGWFFCGPAERNGKQVFKGMMLSTLGVIFLLDLDFGRMWPLMLILPGIALLLGWIGDDDEQADPV